MRIDDEKNRIKFGYHDRYFLRRFGYKKAVSMVLEHTRSFPWPFVCDVHQLADVLRISRKDLFALTNGCNERYLDFDIKKKNGGKRHISVPDPFLVSVQRDILSLFLNHFEISKYATAYHKGARLRDNALPHCGKKNVLKMDIVDFFGSINFLMIRSCVFNARTFPDNIGTMLSTLCCRNDCLPQGAPTSPTISNIVMKRFDDYLGSWCEERGVAYTRYCDDLTFSGDCDLYRVYSKAKKLLENMGFEVNEKKTAFLGENVQQRVTGVVVNEKPSVSREERRKLRQELYYFYKFGDKKAMEKYGSDMSKSDYFRHLYARIAYVLQIDPDNAEFVAEKKKMDELARSVL